MLVRSEATNKKAQGGKRKKKNGTELGNWDLSELWLELNHMLIFLFIGQRRLDLMKLQTAAF